MRDRASLATKTRGLPGLAAVVATLALYLWQVGRYLDYVNDDAFITFRYSRFLARGLGPYFNVGEHVEGYTNFLLMLLLAPVIRWFGEGAALPVAKSVGVVAGGVSLLLAVRLATALERSGGGRGTAGPAFAGILAAGLVAVCPFFALNSTSGLETTLFAACLIAGVYLGVVGGERGAWRGAGLAFAAAALTRPEGVVLFAVWASAVAAVELTSRARSQSAALRLLRLDLLIVAAVVSGHLLFRLLVYDGEWLPNTFYAKSGGFFKVTSWEYVRRGALDPLLGPWVAGTGLVAFLGLGGALRLKVPVAAVAVAGALLPFATGTDWMLGWRLVVPYMPLVAVVVATGWLRLATLLARRQAWLAPALLALSVPWVWAIQRWDGTALREEITVRSRGYRTGHTALAEWLRAEAARPGEAVALMDIGIVGYLCIDQHVLDLTGLTDRFIAKSPGGFLVKQYDPAYVLDRRPEFIVVVLSRSDSFNGSTLEPWTPMEARIVSHPEFRRSYLAPASAAVPGEHWTDGIARRIGAERIFVHDYPGDVYLLTVFRRQDRPGPA